MEAEQFMQAVCVSDSTVIRLLQHKQRFFLSDCNRLVSDAEILRVRPRGVGFQIFVHYSFGIFLIPVRVVVWGLVTFFGEWALGHQ